MWAPRRWEVCADRQRPWPAPAQLHSAELLALAPDRHQQPGIDGSRLYYRQPPCLSQALLQGTNYKALQGATRHYQRLVSQTTLLRILQGQKGQRVRIVILYLEKKSSGLIASPWILGASKGGSYCTSTYKRARHLSVQTEYRHYLRLSSTYLLGKV